MLGGGVSGGDGEVGFAVTLSAEAMEGADEAGAGEAAALPRGGGQGECDEGELLKAGDEGGGAQLIVGGADFGGGEVERAVGAGEEAVDLGGGFGGAGAVVIDGAAVGVEEQYGESGGIGG